MRYGVKAVKLQLGSVTGFSHYLDIEQQIRVRGDPKSPTLFSHRYVSVAEGGRYVQQRSLAFFHLQHTGRPTLDQIDTRLKFEGCLHRSTILDTGRPTRRRSFAIFAFDVQSNVTAIAVISRDGNRWPIALGNALDDHLICHSVHGNNVGREHEHDAQKEGNEDIFHRRRHCCSDIALDWIVAGIRRMCRRSINFNNNIITLLVSGRS
mmetsp:Transcript_22938/g.63654  ORF Transcript_22938/g.63654 Transcript_22938/m.63654 type:complete len:208 (-) Transcript_22938:54-677(-)